MAESPSHKFGQIIGDALEDAVRPLLEEFAKEHRLYLDQKGPRPCRKGLKCSWVDLHGNVHDLDFVLERGGTARKSGEPVAFIEAAWRRYTKHSRNKAQEIQGAIEPLAERFNEASPFKGAILAGVFTEGAIEQLKSLGFIVLFLPYKTVIKAFKHVDIDAFFDEDTPDASLQERVDRWNALPASAKAKVPAAMSRLNKSAVQAFMTTLDAAVCRRVARILVLPLHGAQIEFSIANQAIKAIESYNETVAQARFERYEVQIRFTNGNEIIGKFNDKAGAIHFLQPYRLPGKTETTKRK